MGSKGFAKEQPKGWLVGFFLSDGMFSILVLVVVTQTYTCVKTYRTIYKNNFIICQF